MYYSPLRYPGGKNKLAAFLAKICIDNNIDGHYVEPYAGGASVALFLLIEGFVNKITINDKDRSIYAFWHSVIKETDRFIELVEKAEFTIEEWRKQKQVQKEKETASLLNLGFSTFYLNRTNRSGIIYSGVMGGINQKGDYLMDCRFNKVDLIDRIRKIVRKKESIRILNDDAIDLIDRIQKESVNDNVIFYFDPPYYLRGNSLYMNHYKPQSHKLVSKKIKAIQNLKWIVSYDNVPEIQQLYTECPRKEYSFKHTAYKSRMGKEVLFFSNNLIQPQITDWNPIRFKAKRKKTILKDIVYK